jgi:hypothetical protein
MPSLTYSPPFHHKSLMAGDQRTPSTASNFPTTQIRTGEFGECHVVRRLGRLSARTRHPPRPERMERRSHKLGIRFPPPAKETAAIPRCPCRRRPDSRALPPPDLSLPHFCSFREPGSSPPFPGGTNGSCMFTRILGRNGLLRSTSLKCRRRYIFSCDRTRRLCPTRRNSRN